MNTPPSEPFEKLLSDLIDGELTDQGRKELIERLAEDPQRFELLSTHLHISEFLSQQLPIRREDILLPAISDHIESLGTQDEQVFIDGLCHRIRSREIMRNMAIAAAITLLLVPVAWFSLRSDRMAGDVAQGIHLDKAGKTIGTEGVKPGQRLKLTSGFLKLQFSNGAVVTVEGPAALKVVSETRIELFNGRLNGWCPYTAHGFQVVSDGTTLTDLGTSFGVNAGMDGKNDFVVMDGAINLRKNSESRILNEGKAVSTNNTSGLSSVSFEPSQFKHTWALTSGIIATSGSVVPAKPDTPENLASLRNDSEVMVVPEARALPFDQPIRAEITTPGHLVMAKSRLALKNVAPRPGVLLHSYLLRVDPETQLTGTGHIHFEGSVTFDRPVIAIFVTGKSLKVSDQRFANGEWPELEPNQYPGLRGLEENWNTTIHDEVTLSEDRRTVWIAFHTGTSTDDIRVITGE